MIFYFSGTGNSEWVAEKIAENITDRAVDISRITDIPDTEAENIIGFVFPVYAWGIAEPMKNFARKLKKTEAFSFGVCTYGENAGKTMKKFFGEYAIDSAYGIEMPNNYLLGEDLEDSETVLRKIAVAKKEIKRICAEITERKKIYRVNEGKLAWLKSGIVNFGFNKFARSVKPFRVVADKCVGCEYCAEHCPSSAISMSEGHPVWNGKCYMCLKCINCCPYSAIEYGNKTEGRRRYFIKNYLSPYKKRSENACVSQ